MGRPRSSEQGLTPLELEIMTILWETGPANVQTVQGNIKGRNLAYTTVQTMLNVLHRKGKVTRRLRDRAYLYAPLLSRRKAVTQALGDMLDRFFSGSAESLVLGLLETRHLTPKRLAQLQKMLEQSKKETRGND